MKKCVECKEEKEELLFNRDTKAPDGLRYICRSCQSAAATKYRAEHREERIQKDKQYYEAHKEERKIQDKEYYREHIDEKKAYDKAYREANSEERKRKQKEYYESHKEEFLAKQKIYLQRKREKIREECKKLISQQGPIPEFAMGVYKIRNLISGKFYIGSTVSFRNRRDAHFKELRSGVHNNRRLQAAFNKYGENAFVFEPIEIIDHEDKLLEREQYYLDTLLPFGRSGYNISKLAGEPGNRGKAAIKTFSFQDKDGNVITVTNLSEWCREHKLDDNRMRAMLRGKILTWKGYAPIGYSLQKSINTKYEFVSPDGELFVITEKFKVWCKAHSLTPHQMRAVHRGAMDNHKGWTKHKELLCTQ